MEHEDRTLNNEVELCVCRDHESHLERLRKVCEHHVRVESEGFADKTQIYLNGEKLKGVTHFTYDIDANGFGKATFTVFAKADIDVKVDSEDIEVKLHQVW